jgi:hypothetical protein
MKLHRSLSIFYIFVFVVSLKSFNAFNSFNISTKSTDNIIEKRGTPSYDYVIEKDLLPHFRVFFWVDKNATNYVPYADEGINTNVSSHGPAERWSVVETDTIREKEKLVYVYVPKTFVILHSRDFDKLIHLEAIMDN